MTDPVTKPEELKGVFADLQLMWSCTGRLVDLGALGVLPRPEAERALVLRGRALAYEIAQERRAPNPAPKKRGGKKKNAKPADPPTDS